MVCGRYLVLGYLDPYGLKVPVGWFAAFSGSFCMRLGFGKASRSHGACLI